MRSGYITRTLFSLFLLILSPSLAFALAGSPVDLHMSMSTIGIIAISIFIIAYIAVMSEEFIHLRKSKPVVLAAGVIWMLVLFAASAANLLDEAVAALRHNLLEYVEIFLFLLVAMTYVNAMTERNVFQTLRAWLVRKGFSFRQLFWITGVLAFFISPIADNLTTALIMCAVVMAVGANNARFVTLACINIVVAANAGGAFSPFGDITTLMVWQQGILPFHDFFQIFLPSVVNFLVPAIIMSLAVPKVTPAAVEEHVTIKVGGKRVIMLFLLTIAITVLSHHFIHLPPAVGMMTGLALLKFFSYYIQRFSRTGFTEEDVVSFDIFRKVQNVEWDTLLFFYGVILCVGGLATLGYLGIISDVIYNQWGAGLSEAMRETPANVAVGILSAIIDNIPVMFAVLTMNPQMSEGQWLLATLTAGVGGSILSVGSAAGVALMGQTRGLYTFFSHLKWTWAIVLGYIASILVHIWVNGHLF